MKIDRSKPISLYIQVREELLKEIKTKYKSGDKIPSEVELMKIFGVGRSTIRDAVRELVSLGFLEKKHGFGTFVSKSNSSSAIKPLISMSFNLKTGGIDNYNEVLKKEYVNTPKEIKEIFDITTDKKMLHIKRKRWVDKKPLVIEDSWLTSKIYSSFSNPDFSSSLVDLIVKNTNITIKKFDQVITFSEPTAEEKKTLELDDEDKIISMIRTIYVKDESQPVFYLKFITTEKVLPNLGFSF
jgi:GntR family transcriptional regulator